MQLVALLQSLKDRIKALDKHIAQALAAHADAEVFTSLPAPGPFVPSRCSPRSVTRFGVSPPRTPSLPLPGSRPSTRASGRARSVIFRHGCNRRRRQALVDVADGSRKGSPWAQAIYERARARGARHAHAIRILARAWIRAIWRCWNDGLPYQPDRHGGVLELHQVPG